MSKLTPQSDVLSFTPSKTSTNSNKISKNNKQHQANDSNLTQDDRQSFLNSLLACIDKNNEFLPDRMKISQKEVLSKTINRLEKGAFDESDKISIFQSASFMQILSLLDKLKANAKDIKLGNLSNGSYEFIKTEADLNAFKAVSNLHELLDIAKDLGLNIKNIKIDRLFDLKTTFPNLDKADFFKTHIDNIFKEVIHNKITHITKNLKSYHRDHFANASMNYKENFKDDNLLSETLKNLDSMLMSKKNEYEKITIKDVLDVKNQNDSFKKSHDKSKDDDVLTQDITNLKIFYKKDKDTSKEFNKNQENIKEEDKNLNKEIIKNSRNLSSHPMQKDLSLTKETKINHKDMKDIKQKINFENLNKIQTIQNKDDYANCNVNTDKETFSQEQIKTQNTNKNPLDELNSLVKDLSKTTQNHTRNITPKETLEYFSKDLKEALNEYKAPITKLSITLNPNNLGEVEVTLIQRGNNLHINFNSNTHAMNLFMQHQVEFKNSLVNMGFTALEMNFNDQGKREQNQEKNRNGNSFKHTLDGKNESENVNLELILAKYF